MQLQTGHEQHCLDHAEYFTAVRRVAGERSKHRFETLDGALSEARKHSDGRTMIYAVTAMGLSAHLCNA